MTETPSVATQKKYWLLCQDSPWYCDLHLQPFFGNRSVLAVTEYKPSNPGEIEETTVSSQRQFGGLRFRLPFFTPVQLSLQGGTDQIYLRYSHPKMKLWDYVDKDGVSQTERGDLYVEAAADKADFAGGRVDFQWAGREGLMYASRWEGSIFAEMERTWKPTPVHLRNLFLRTQSGFTVASDGETGENRLAFSNQQIEDLIIEKAEASLLLGAAGLQGRRHFFWGYLGGALAAAYVQSDIDMKLTEEAKALYQQQVVDKQEGAPQSIEEAMNKGLHFHKWAPHYSLHAGVGGVSRLMNVQSALDFVKAFELSGYGGIVPISRRGNAFNPATYQDLQTLIWDASALLSLKI